MGPFCNPCRLHAGTRFATALQPTAGVAAGVANTMPVCYLQRSKPCAIHNRGVGGRLQGLGRVVVPGKLGGL